MTAEWMPVFVLPNISLEAAIDCDIAALAPAHDRRVATLKRMHPMLRRFLNRSGTTVTVLKFVGLRAAGRPLAPGRRGQKSKA